MYMADSGVVNFTGASTSVRANEFSAPHIGIGTHTTTSNLHLAGDSPEMKIQDVVDQTTETAFKVVVNGGTTHFQTGTTFTDGSDGTLKFQNMGGTNTHVTINALGDLVAANNVSANTITATIINDAFEQTTAHDREASVLKKYPEVVMNGPQTNAEAADDNKHVQSGYIVTTSSTHPNNGRLGWRAFNGDHTSGWISASGSWNSSTDVYQGGRGLGGYSGEWIKLSLPHAIKVENMYIEADLHTGRRPTNGYLLGSNDDSTWSVIKQLSSIPNEDRQTLQIGASNYYKYIAFLTETITSGSDTLWIDEIEYYGYEEVGTTGDTSLDTTMKSVYNTPDLTSASLYIDGLKGSTATDYSGNDLTVTVSPQVTYDSTEKAWELTGVATSNIVTADLGFEGDQPHSISAWVKADQLGYGTPLFHLGTNESVSDAASRVGFVDDSHISWGGEDHYFSNAEWHNVTYTYNGQGSDKKLYLDGRLVGSAKNEDTFGDYPPFAMSTYSEYGYTVSASTDAYDTATTPFYAWKAFNNTVGNEGWHAGEYQNGTDWYLTYVGNVAGAVYDTANYSRSIGGIDGEWLKLEMPHKLCVDYITLKSRTNANDQAPKDFKILGSNDDVNWDVLSSHTGVTASETGTTHNVGASKSYKYLTIVVTRVQRSTGSDAHLVIGELSYHGHRENDLVRFPDPTNVLKYPHVAMTGPAQRGYVATASSAYDTGDTTDREAYKAFDGSTNYNNPNRWICLDGKYNTSGVYVGSESHTDVDGNTETGEWLKIQLPRKVTVDHFNVRAYPTNGSQTLRNYAILGSNDNSTWYQVHKRTGSSSGTADNTDITPSGTYSSDPFKIFLFIWHDKVADVNQHVSMSELSIYGTEEDSDVVARIGDGYDGKVRNLRVFSTALSQDRVQEIFDADKDEFGLAKSSISVYRGHLGIGTTEPKAALTVMDEVAELEEFPPRAMTNYETYIEGHGVFRASVTSVFATNYEGWRAFNKNDKSSADPANRWTASLTLSNLGNYTGKWVKLELPYKVKFSKIGILPPLYSGGSAQCPTGFSIIGSNDDVTWTTIKTLSSYAWTEFAYNYISLDHGVFYKYIAIVATTDGTNGYTSFQELRYFGTREQGASTLHNGELSLTRNLTVPRIGPALDADDTPRRDRLVVEYNTSTNPTENGVVKDTSGRSFDGHLINGAIYDATEKAFEFPNNPADNSSSSTGNDSIITRELPGSSLNQRFTVSTWLRLDSPAEWEHIWGFGNDNTALENEILFVANDQLSYQSEGGGGAIYYPYQYAGWNHVTIVRNSATFDDVTFYVNGSVVASTSASSTGNMVKPDKVKLTIGGAITQNSYWLDGAISNFKLYDVALTADEVKRLYDMGRCDEGHHVVNFSKTRVGIGLGDGEAPQEVLDVRDVARFHQIDIHHDTEKDTVINFRHYLAGTVKPWEIGQIMGVNPTGANNSDFKFATSRVVKAWIDSSSSAPTVEINNFTGQHRTFIKDVPFSKANELEGLIVSSDQNKYIKMSGGIEVGSNAITTNESLPVVSVSNVANDKRCFGVISASEDPETRQDRYGNIVSVSVKEKGDTRVYINSVGEGAIWVTDINGPLESGDYITTSNVPGYGMAQSDDLLHNYTVAKITMDCDFNPATQPIKRIKRSNVVETHYTGLVPVIKSVPHEFVTTVVDADDLWNDVSISPSDVTYAQWSNLEANVQNTYTLVYTSTSNVVYDVKYTLTTTANVSESDAWDNVYIDPPEVTWAEYSNLEANVQNTYTVTFTQTTTDEKTPEEWSALDANAQALWSVQYYDMEEQKVDADYPGAVAHDVVTDRLENDLDEHGQIQWEDTDETEKAYKIRYLDAAGAQTDEANCVHRAAFVGCTYHCG